MILYSTVDAQFAGIRSQWPWRLTFDHQNLMVSSSSSSPFVPHLKKLLCGGPEILLSGEQDVQYRQTTQKCNTFSHSCHQRTGIKMLTKALVVYFQ